MNLIITGENPKYLAKIEALANELGLSVRRDFTSPGELPPGKLSGRKKVGTTTEGINERIRKVNPSHESGSLYGIE